MLKHSLPSKAFQNVHLKILIINFFNTSSPKVFIEVSTDSHVISEKDLRLGISYYVLQPCKWFIKNKEETFVKLYLLN